MLGAASQQPARERLCSYPLLPREFRRAVFETGPGGIRMQAETRQLLQGHIVPLTRSVRPLQNSVVSSLTHLVRRMLVRVKPGTRSRTGMLTCPSLFPWTLTYHPRQRADPCMSPMASRVYKTCPLHLQGSATHVSVTLTK